MNNGLIVVTDDEGRESGSAQTNRTWIGMDPPGPPGATRGAEARR